MSNEQMPRPDAATIAQIDKVLKLARAQLVERGAVPHLFSILHGEHGVEMVPGEFRTDADKERTAFMVRNLVEALEAHTVLSVMEIWTLPSGYTPGQVKALYAKHGGLANAPGRIEAVRVTIETRDGKSWDAQANIVRRGRAVKLAPPAYRDLSGAEGGGRFVGWFKPRRNAWDVVDRGRAGDVDPL
jgi:hypothetical protein